MTKKIKKMIMNNDLITIKDACTWASEYINKKVSQSNISYLLNYKKINKYQDNKTILVSKSELKEYYDNFYANRKNDWSNKLGDDINWNLSFENLTEKETTKNVNKLHPYKGKFIPQLVEYFLDNHTDNFKKEIFFKEGDNIFDPFCGSGTTLVVCKELGINAVGVDVSQFNTLLSEVKVHKYNLNDIISFKKKLEDKLSLSKKNLEIDKEIKKELSNFNKKYFDVSKKYDDLYINEKVDEFKKIYFSKIEKLVFFPYEYKPKQFLDKWFNPIIKNELLYINDLIENIDVDDGYVGLLFEIILTRTAHSCIATTHYDLGTLKRPVFEPYYCYKHKKICKPINSCLSYFFNYINDTIKRIEEFNRIDNNSKQMCLCKDSSSFDFRNNPLFEKGDGFFTSPPYLGVINYHEQHSYAYELLDLDRHDTDEIGSLNDGTNNKSKEKYIDSMSNVFLNLRKALKKDFNGFIVANDKYNLYPEIIDKSGMKIVNTYKRPVLNRTERDKNAYSEIIFHVKRK